MKGEFKVIDSEMHLQEPVDFFQRRLPEPYKSQFNVTPPPSGYRIGPNSDQVLDKMLADQGLSYARGLAPSTHHVWIEGKLVPRPAPWVVVRHALRHWPEVPLMAKVNQRCEPGLYLEGMDIEGIDIGILSPTLTFLVLRHDQLSGKLANAICRAYNDWAAEFCAANPGRLKFWGFVAPHDAELAAEEARRCMEKLGAAGVATIQGAINGNLWSDAFFDPLWQELDRLRAPFGFHIAAEGQVKDNLLPRYAGHRRTEVVYNMLGQGGFYAHTTVAELILGGVLERYRNIRPVMMESGASWLPWLLWRMDEKWEAYAPDMDYELSMKPSDYWRTRCYAVIDCGEHVVKYTIDHQGDHNLLVSTDFPHHDSPFPNGIDTFVRLEGLTRDNKRRILWDNGAKLFGLESLAPQPVS
jgi:uncharacterized protein